MQFVVLRIQHAADVKQSGDIILVRCNSSIDQHLTNRFYHVILIFYFGNLLATLPGPAGLIPLAVMENVWFVHNGGTPRIKLVRLLGLCLSLEPLPNGFCAPDADVAMVLVFFYLWWSPWSVAVIMVLDTVAVSGVRSIISSQAPPTISIYALKVIMACSTEFF